MAAAKSQGSMAAYVGWLIPAIAMIRAAIVFMVSNYAVTCFALGLSASAIAIALTSEPRRRALVVDRLLAWYVVFNVGVMFAINFVFHVFFGQLSAAFIGWSDSPFQFEVGTASLGFATAGALAAFGSFDRRLIAVIAPGLFSLGAAAGHIRQMLTTHDFAPGNAGPIFYADIVVPLFGFLLLWLAKPAPLIRNRS